MRVGMLTVLLDLTHSGWLKSEELHKYVKDTNANYVDRVEELEAHVEVLLKSIAVAAKLHNCGADHVCTCCQESWPCGTMKTLDVKEFI